MLHYRVERRTGPLFVKKSRRPSRNQAFSKSLAFNPENWFVPGPPPTGVWEYLYIPVQGNTKFPLQGILHLPTQNSSDWANYPGQLIEREIATKGLFAERKDLIDRSRVYRIELRFLNQFRYDRLGAYIGDKPNQYRFLINDPTLAIGVQRTWAPLE